MNTIYGQTFSTYSIISTTKKSTSRVGVGPWRFEIYDLSTVAQGHIKPTVVYSSKPRTIMTATTDELKQKQSKAI